MQKPTSKVGVLSGPRTVDYVFDGLGFVLFGRFGG